MASGDFGFGRFDFVHRTSCYPKPGSLYRMYDRLCRFAAFHSLEEAVPAGKDRHFSVYDHINAGGGQYFQRRHPG